MRTYRGPGADKQAKRIDALEKELQEMSEKHKTVLEAYNTKCAQYNHLINEANKL